MASSVSVGANAVSTNQLAGLLEEFTRRRTLLRMGAVSSATGINVTCLLNDVAVVNDQFIPLANRFPVIPDDLIIQHVIPAGVRSVVTFRNTTAGALTVIWLVDTRSV
jgi:hypothetical protein